MDPLFIQILIWVTYLITLFLLVYWLIYYFEKKSSMIDDKKKARPKLSRFPFVTITVPAYNEEKHILKTLNSLVRLDYPHDKFEIIVVNDCSTDNTINVVKNFISRHIDEHKKANDAINIRLVSLKKNLGKAGALNTAFDDAKGEYFSCIDADSMVDHDALLYMMEMFQKDPKLAIATPVMKVYKPKNWLQKFQRIEYMSSMLIIKLMGFMNCNYVAPGPFSIYKASVLKKLGKFDGSNNIEDQEIAWRAQKHHYKIRQCSNAIVHTIAPDDMKGLTRQRTRWFRGSLLTMHQYRDLAFNKKYGDFGMFQIPLMFAAYGLSLIGLFLFGYYLIKPIVNKIYDWFLINFDIMTELRHMHFTFNILDIEIAQVLIIFLALAVTIGLLYISSRNTDERVRKYGTIYLVPYFFLYYVLLGFILIKSLVDISLKRKQKW